MVIEEREKIGKVEREERQGDKVVIEKIHTHTHTHIYIYIEREREIKRRWIDLIRFNEINRQRIKRVKK